MMKHTDRETKQRTVERENYSLFLTKRDRISNILNLCLKKNIKATEYGDVWHLKGNGIDILTRDLSSVQPYELDPNTGRSQYAND